MAKAQEQNTPAVAVIGCGYWGKNLIRNYHLLGALTLICDKNEKALADFKAQYADVETCIALADVLTRTDIAGVVISSPAETHFSIAREALLAGKHVFVEKPLTLRGVEGEELIALAAEKHKILMVGHLLQYHPVFMRLKEMASSGELGRINYIYSHRLNLGKIRREENILWSFAPHDISMILSLAEEEPENVMTTGGNYLHQKIADVTTTHLEFPSGLRAHVFVSWLHPFKDQKLVVVGDRKMAVFDDTQPWNDKLLLYQHEIQWKNHMPVPTKADAERADIPEEEPLRQECRHFLECITNRSTPITDGHEGLRVLNILNASQASLNAGGQKIDLKTKDASDPYLTEPKYIAHPTAVIDEGVTIGDDTKIWHFAHILSGSTVGRRCNLGQNVMVGPDVSIGDNCKLQNNVSVYQGVTLEDGVFCGPSMVFTNIYNPRAEIRKMDQVRPTRVKKGTTIGANATIICGVTLGRYSFIGAGALVNRNVPDFAIVAGNPARQIGWSCECGERLTDDLECLGCGKHYEKKAGELEKIG
jgi:UDP-2-acetamido-3-amino-2,3-dideoxy-glucuronate N-acetyltransferase